MRLYGQVEFETEVNKAYDILWKMHESGDWDDLKDRKLLNMLNTIDEMLDR